MTPKCPKCSTDLRDDYGMVTCPSCGAIVFVDMDGAAHVATDQPTFEAPPVAEADFGSADIFAPPPLLESEPMAIEPFSPPSEAATEAAAERAIEGVSEGVPDQAGEMDMNAFLGYDPDPAQVAANAAADAARASQNDPNDPLGLSAYANSELSGAKNGPLVVSIVISGIDAKDLRDEIRQALQDSRFGWDTAALMSGIKGGVLRIERVSPVKATILINRIKNLSVRIRWEQSAITEIDPTEKDL